MSKFDFSKAKIIKSQIGNSNKMNQGKKKVKKERVFVMYEKEGQKYLSKMLCDCSKRCFLEGNRIDFGGEFNDEVDICENGNHASYPGGYIETLDGIQIECNDDNK